MSTQPCPQSQWYHGQLMAFSGIDGQTRYRDELVARTVLAPAGIEIVMPAKCRIRFNAKPSADIHAASDWFSFATQGGQIQGAFLNCTHILIEGDCQVEECPEQISFVQKNGRLLLGVKTHFEPQLIDSDLTQAMAQRQHWINNLALGSGRSIGTQRALHHACSVMKSQVYSAEGKIPCRWTTPDRWPHYDMWLWDSAFHAIGLRHLDPQLAMDAISAMFCAQRADGFLPHRAHTGGAASQITQPPILAFATRLVYEKSNNPDWLRTLYPQLCTYVQWDLNNRDSDGGGLAEWVIDDDPLCRSGESGMDNSPRFDSAVRLDVVDFNAFLALECEALAHLATLLGLSVEQERWSKRHKILCRLINKYLWSDADGFYFDYNPTTGSRTPVLSSAGLLPLICGAPTTKQAEQLLAALSDPNRFATAFPIPSIAVSDTRNYAKDMWRGPVWININWLVAYGLERYGFASEAHSLRKTTTTAMEAMYERYGVFFEYYDDRAEVPPPALLRKEICDPANPYRQVIHDFGWSATLYADMVLSH